MATLTFDGVWLNVFGDEADCCHLPLAALELAPLVTVTVAPYAGFDDNGRPVATYRAVEAPGRQETAKITLAIITGAQQKWLSDHLGVVVCFRDGIGTKFYGLFTDPTFSPYWGFDGWVGPAATIQQVTVSEAAS